METRIMIPQEEVAAFCQRWRVVELALFGSVLRDDFGPDSDVDVLVRFESEQTPGLFGIVRMEQELSELLGRQVDVVTRGAVENSRNYIRRKAILNSAQVVYAA
jgi:predicted nucleotidyltransferase